MILTGLQTGHLPTQKFLGPLIGHGRWDLKGIPSACLFQQNLKDGLKQTNTGRSPANCTSARR